MILKHNIGDEVYYLSAWHDGILRGKVIGVHPNTNDLHNFVMLTISNNDWDEGAARHEIINIDDAFSCLEAVYDYLKEYSYTWHTSDLMPYTDRKEYDKEYDENYGMKTVQEIMDSAYAEFKESEEIDK